MNTQARWTARLAVGALALGAAAMAAADAGETVKRTTEKVVSATTNAVTKAEDAVKKGAGKASDAIERGVKAANDGTGKVARKMGLPEGTAADAKKAQQAQERKADINPAGTVDALPPAGAKTQPSK